jgi:hypothetical protein
MPSPFLQRQFSGPFGIADRGRGAEGAALTGRKGWILPHHAKARFAVLQNVRVKSPSVRRPSASRYLVILFQISSPS